MKMIIFVALLASATYGAPMPGPESPPRLEGPLADIPVPESFASALRTILRNGKQLFNFIAFESKDPGVSEDVAIRKSFELVGPIQEQAAFYTEELRLTSPIVSGLYDAKLHEGDEEGQRKAFRTVGEGLWKALNSDKAATVLGALLRLVEDNELWPYVPSPEWTVPLQGTFAEGIPLADLYRSLYEEQ